MVTSPHTDTPTSATKDASTRTLTKRRSALWRNAQRAPRLISLASVALIAIALVLTFLFAPGAKTFQQTFLDPTELRETIFGNAGKNIAPIWGALLKNIELFLVAEPIILVLALGVALVRLSKSPLMTGPRIIAIMYVDVARGLPLILVVYAVYFGLPLTSIPVLSTMTYFQYGIICLVFCYTAYVSEVYRAGVMSVPNAQLLAGRAIGLTESQLLRNVTVPQAVRVVVAPLINDFVSLQKDTAIISVGSGVVEIMSQAHIDQSIWFRDTPFIIAGLFFLVMCVPLTRIADAVLARDLRTRLSGSPVTPRRRWSARASAESMATVLQP